MLTSVVAREINFVKVGAVAAFLLTAMLVAVFTSLLLISSADPLTETKHFLDDLVDRKNYVTALVWLYAFASLLTVPVFVGLYHGLRRWGEEQMRISLIAGVVSAILGVLAVPLQAATAADIVPDWFSAADAAARATMESNAKAVQWASDAMLGIFGVAIGMAVIAASLVMLRLRRRFWTGLGTIGIVGIIAGSFGAFELMTEGLSPIDLIGIIPAFFWILGIGAGLWHLPAAETAA